MKHYLIIFFCIVSAILKSQNDVNGFRIGQTVNFNDVVNSIGDRTKIITEPSQYLKGQNIVYKDLFNRKVTLYFVENSQVLRGYFIEDVTTQQAKAFYDQIMLFKKDCKINGYAKKISGKKSEYYYSDESIKYDLNFKEPNTNKILHVYVKSNGAINNNGHIIPYSSISVQYLNSDSEILKPESDLSKKFFPEEGVETIFERYDF